MNYMRLPLAFDPQRLRADLERIEPDAWVPHFNTSHYDGEWSGVSLRAVDGDARHIFPDHTATTRYADTPVLARSPYFREVLSAFRCPLTSARLLKLAAGSNIHEHRDYKLGHEHGEVRIHVPIVTNDKVAFFLEGERVRMEPGEAWYLNLELPHRVDNQSETDRVHLVIDCIADDWLNAMLADEAPPAPAPPRPARPPRVPRGAPVFRDPTASAIAEFLRGIGLAVEAGAVEQPGFVPGIWIDQGVLVVDEARLRYPGDMLHEAGHLAVMAPSRRPAITGDAGSDPAEEMMAIAWSYAAALHLRLDPAVVFHEAGYRGGSASLLENFAAGRYIGVPVLQWLGMTFDAPRAAERGVAPYPHMTQWLRTQDA